MDQVIEHWQSIGVDGFRCDMSHMVPPEFWSWVIAQARSRQPDVFFIGEAYNDDPSKVPGSDPVIAGLHWGKGNVLFDLLNSRMRRRRQVARRQSSARSAGPGGH